MGDGSGWVLDEGEEGGDNPADRSASAGLLKNCSWSFSEFHE